MKRIEEHGVFAEVVGTSVHVQRLARIGLHRGQGPEDYADCQEYLVGDISLWDRALTRMLQIPDKLVDQWVLEGIHFSLHLYVKAGALRGGHVCKFKKNTLLQGYAMAPTRQEIRITRRILAFLTDSNVPCNGHYGSSS